MRADRLQEAEAEQIVEAFSALYREMQAEMAGADSMSGVKELAEFLRKQSSVSTSNAAADSTGNTGEHPMQAADARAEAASAKQRELSRQVANDRDEGIPAGINSSMAKSDKIALRPANQGVAICLCADDPVWTDIR